jgi:NarL family two-component system response regulator LiaR
VGYFLHIKNIKFYKEVIMENNIKIMLVEDHKLIRVGIKTLFDETEGYDVIAEAEFGQDAINKAITFKPDIILVSESSLPE